jgi:hypothetical protein
MRREDFMHLYPALKRRAKFIRRYASKTLNQSFLKFVLRKNQTEACADCGVSLRALSSG